MRIPISHLPTLTTVNRHHNTYTCFAIQALLTPVFGHSIIKKDILIQSDPTLSLLYHCYTKTLLRFAINLFTIDAMATIYIA